MNCYFPRDAAINVAASSIVAPAKPTIPPMTPSSSDVLTTRHSIFGSLGLMRRCAKTPVKSFD